MIANDQARMHARNALMGIRVGRGADFDFEVLQLLMYLGLPVPGNANGNTQAPDYGRIALLIVLAMVAQ